MEYVFDFFLIFIEKFLDFLNCSSLDKKAGADVQEMKIVLNLSQVFDIQTLPKDPCEEKVKALKVCIEKIKIK